MKLHSKLAAITGVISIALVATGYEAAAQTKLRVFVGSQNRPDVMRELFDMYHKKNPNVTVELETGGATSELQRSYLSTVLTAKDSSLDVMLIDIVNPAQYAASGWLEPLDAYIKGGKEQLLASYLPAYSEADTIDGKLVALPAFADAMMLFYRTDLFQKHGATSPKTWTEAIATAKKVQTGEGDQNLQGISFQGRAIEGAVCTFLLPYWSQGGTIDQKARTPLDEKKAVESLNLWLSMVAQGVAKKNIAEVGTDDTRKEFQAGNVAMAVLWPYGWAHFQGPESAVKGKVAVSTLPVMEGGTSATCMGGYQWAVSAFSQQKQAAADLIQYLASPEASRFLAVKGSFLPTSPELYKDPEVLKANAWFEQALPIVQGARARPVTPNYARVSDAIRTQVNSVLAGSEQPEQAVKALQGQLVRALR